MPMPPLSNVSSPRGAPFGRPDCHPVGDRRTVKPVLLLERLRFEDGDYDQGGAYWGAPATVWRIYGEVDEGVIDFFRRATSRSEAEAAALKAYPLATFADPEPDGLHAAILNGMALAFFATAYADQAEECGQPLSGEIMNQLPDAIDPAALHAAETLSMGILDGITFEPDEHVTTDAQRMLVVYMHLSNGYDRKDADRELTPELFGHYCAMQAMGTGVGLESFGDSVKGAIKVPYVEFGSYSLEKDYFTPTDDEDE